MREERIIIFTTLLYFKRSNLQTNSVEIQTAYGIELML